MKKLLLYLFSILSGISSTSQEYIDLFKLEYQNSPSNSFDNSEAVSTLNEFSADFTYPYLLGARLTILTGATYEYLGASFNPEESVKSFSGITLKAGLNIKHSDKLSATYLFLPEIASDFGEISNRDYQKAGLILMKYTKSENLNYRFGVYASDELFGPLVVPLFGFYYLSAQQKFEVKTVLPIAVDMNYLLKQNIRLGLDFRAQVRSFDPTINEELDSQPYLSKYSNDVCAYFHYGLENGVNFKLGFGRSVGRYYRVYDEKVSLALPLAIIGDDREQLNTDFSDGWIFRFSVFYRYFY